MLILVKQTPVLIVSIDWLMRLLNRAVTSTIYRMPFFLLINCLPYMFKLLICMTLKMAVHSIPSYPGTLGPGTARISDMPVTQNRTHTLQITYLSPTSR